MLPLLRCLTNMMEFIGLVVEPEKKPEKPEIKEEKKEEKPKKKASK